MVWVHSKSQISRSYFMKMWTKFWFDLCNDRNVWSHLQFFKESTEERRWERINFCCLFWKGDGWWAEQEFARNSERERKIKKVGARKREKVMFLYLTWQTVRTDKADFLCTIQPLNTRKAFHCDLTGTNQWLQWNDIQNSRSFEKNK